MVTNGAALRDRKSYPKKKRLMYQELQELPLRYSVIALSKMTKIRATQLMTIRKKFRNEIQIRVIKNRVAQRAFEKVKDIAGLEELSSELEGQCALLFTNISPFKLSLLFDKNKVFLAAKGGDISPQDIILPSGNTGLSPGPVLSEFKEANVATKIDQGSIVVTKDTVVSKAGNIISQKLASLMSKLNIKPIEAGILVNFAIAEGLSFKGKDLKINLKDYRFQLLKASQEALVLATAANYITSQTIMPLLLRAYRDAQSLVIGSGYISGDTIEILISTAQVHAQNLAHETRKKGYEPT